MIADFLDQFHRDVEIALDLERFPAIGQRLRELAVGDFPLGDEDDRVHPGDGGVGGHRSGGVAGRGTGDRLRAQKPGRRGAAGHAAILERAGGVFPFVLELEIRQTGVFARQPRRVEACVAFLARDDETRVHRQDQLAVAPDAGVVRERAAAPAGVPEAAQVEPLERFEVVFQIQDVTTGAAVTNLHRVVFGAARHAAKFDGVLQGVGHIKISCGLFSTTPSRRVEYLMESQTPSIFNPSETKCPSILLQKYGETMKKSD